MIEKRRPPEKQKTGNSLEVSWNVIYLFSLVLLGMTFMSGYYLGHVKGSSTTVLGATAAQAPLPAEGGALAPQEDLSQIPEVNDSDYVRGNRNAQVILVEYSDYECPFCKRFHPTMQQVVKDYGDKAAWVYRHIPLSFHAKAQKTAEAAECAGELGGNEGFWKMSDAIFEKMPELELAELPGIAKEIGLNEGKFKSCLDSGKHAEKIKQQMNTANAAGISGTPGTVIIARNGKRDFVGGAYPIEEVKAKIDALLK